LILEISMTKFISVAILATVATLTAAPSVAYAAESNQQVQAAGDAVASAAAAATAGKMLYGPDGRRIGSVYRVASNGNAELILDGKLVRVPAATLSEVGGKLTTSLTKKELNRR
jgi:hypothetical protein